MCSNEHSELAAEAVCSSEHIEFTAEAAREGIVLLKNDNETLPSDHRKFKTLAVVGPHANNATTSMIGNYAGIGKKIYGLIFLLVFHANTALQLMVFLHSEK